MSRLNIILHILRVVIVKLSIAMHFKPNPANYYFRPENDLMFVCLFVDSLRPINNLSVKQGLVFLG